MNTTVPMNLYGNSDEDIIRHLQRISWGLNCSQKIPEQKLLSTLELMHKMHKCVLLSRMQSVPLPFEVGKSLWVTNPDGARIRRPDIHSYVGCLPYHTLIDAHFFWLELANCGENIWTWYLQVEPCGRLDNLRLYRACDFGYFDERRRARSY